VPSNANSDRYDPLPGLTELPAFLIRKLSPRGRRAAAIIGALLLVGLAVGLYFGIPAITDTKQERAAADRRAAAEHEAQLVAQLRAEQRLVDGRGTPAAGLQGHAAINARELLEGDLVNAVTRDADARVQSGEFTHSIRRVECERYPRGAHGENPATDLSSPTGRYSCLAITADSPQTALSSPSVIGYPYRALVDFPTGKFTFCKFSGRPGEGSLTRKIRVPLPRACGGGP
jgi:hypothetical protein